MAKKLNFLGFIIRPHVDKIRKISSQLIAKTSSMIYHPKAYKKLSMLTFHAQCIICMPKCHEYMQLQNPRLALTV